MSKGRPALLLDRDGTLIEEKDYLKDPALVELCTGAAEAILAARKLGWAVAVLTNQSGVARGRLTLEDVDAVNAEVERQLAALGVAVDGFFVCPHGPGDEGCGCRKPLPGLASQAAALLGLDLSRSVVVGDKKSDLQLGAAVGATPVLVLTGYGFTADHETKAMASYIADDLSGLPAILADMQFEGDTYSSG